MEGLGDGHSDYTIQATGQIEMVDGRLGGVSVSRDSDAPVTGSTQNGTVWAGADGYRIYGGIKEINIDNPDHVQVHTGKIVGGRGPGDQCEVVVRAEKVEFIEGQGPGEGALELEIEHDIRGGQSERTNTKLPVGSTRTLDAAIDNFKVPQGGSEDTLLTTAVTEREVGNDWFVGQPDEGSDSIEITLECDQPKQVSNNVRIDSDRDNPGEVKVYYTVDTLSD